MSTPKLFRPITVGDITLAHRMALAPLTRCRAGDDHVPGPHAVEYYTQRASTPGTLLITEGTFVSANGGGFNYVPGIWNDAQIAAWKKIADAVHERGSYIFMQIYAAGRQADPTALEKDGLKDAFAGPSPIALKRQPEPIPRALTVEEIKEFVQLHAAAASNAVHKAGFDGVEVHCANGYLLDQFLQDNANQRHDEYGGSIKNRARFSLEVIKAVTDAIGEKKTGVRISPWGTWGDMRMKDPKPAFAYLVTRLRDLYPNLAFLHLVEPGVSGAADVDNVPEGDSNDFVREIWQPRRIISAGCYTRSLALETAEKYDYIIAFGRTFLANPDLPWRVMKNIPFNPHIRATFYSKGAVGYTDYPFAEIIKDTNGHASVVVGN